MRDRETILASRWLKPFAHLFAHPALWHLNRRSVPRALAAGLFVAFVIPVGQFVLAALVAVTTRGNVPLAAASTLISNPITFAPIYLGAYKLGALLLPGTTGQGAGQPAYGAAYSIAAVSGATALGLLLFAVAASTLGYAAGAALWRLKLVSRWKTRSRQPRSGGCLASPDIG